MIAFDERHPLKVLGDDGLEVLRREAMIAERLRAIKEGTTAKALGLSSAVGERTMQGLFKRPGEATAETVGALCDHLGVDVSAIRGRADPMPTSELAAIYENTALTDSDRRLIADTAAHLLEMRAPPRIPLADRGGDPDYGELVREAEEQGKRDAAKIE